MVIDTSALLAIVFNEKTGLWFSEQMECHRGSLTMSTVNLTETLILVRSRQARLYDEIRERISALSIRFVPPTVKQAEAAAEVRLLYPLNLGDCFAYALAKEEACPILTTDPDFRKTDIEVVMPQE